MKEFALISLIRRVLNAKTKGAAMEIVGNVGDEYLPIIQEIVARITFKRTGDQNDFIHGWFSEIGKQTGESMLEVKRRAKLDIGCLILCRDDPDFLEFCKKAMGPYKDRETRLKMMDFVSVTSAMTTKQLSEFADTFEKTHRAEGYALTVPGDKQ